MKIDVLVAEIGSTTTVVNAFGGEPMRFLGQGFAPTTVLQGDVAIGLEDAREDLRNNLGLDKIVYDRFLATSSAAGGLRMTVHGLVYDMTVKAGREAALGAGANIAYATAGKLSDGDLEQVLAVNPNLVLLSGGTDYGDKDTALYNAGRLLTLADLPPVIYCGNIQNHHEIKRIFDIAGKKLYITENVYPRLDELNIEPVRRLIHHAFEEHITNAPGMENLRKLVDGAILPTPGAVMMAAALLYEEIGDLLVIDIGGATTDIHSVTAGDEDITAISIAPEPLMKRTVEGDLGLYINADKVAEQADISIKLPIKPIPQTDEEIEIVSQLAYHAAKIALVRHTGQLRHTFSPRGRRTHATGRDLTAVTNFIATGGALTRLPKANEIMHRLTQINTTGTMLYPKPDRVSILTDHKYIMASLGVLSIENPEAAGRMMAEYVNKEKI
ncbi:MAG: glutamate mutase L [Defluviitaleaceae bacterium]|nr:glutamate mutase L [Defluviitaleaceae bacterium]